MGHHFAPSAVPTASRHGRADACDDSCRIDEYCIYFVTGNAKKEKEVNAILERENIQPFRVSHLDIDLPEIQGSPHDICRAKVAAAAELVGGGVLVEDTSLSFNALNGLPGPYIKWFWQDLGNRGLWNMLEAYDDKGATARCMLGFASHPGAEPIIFEGTTMGTITPPQGDGGFGWDAIFIPEGYTLPFGEMPMSEKNQISHRGKALTQFVAHCREHTEAILMAANANIL